MKYLRILVTFLICFSIVACATTAIKPIPMPLDSKSSGVGISLKLQGHISESTSIPSRIYFIRLEEGTDSYPTEVAASNYENENRFYLLNIIPGRYAAVAVYQLRRYQYTTFLPEKIIKLTEVTVDSGEFAYMGDYIVKQKSMGLLNPDKAQKHFHNIIAGITKNLLFQFFTGNWHSGGKLIEVKNGREDKENFLMKAKEDFKESYWSKIMVP